MSNGFRVIEGGRGAGCGFLSDAEIEAYLSGELDAERGHAFSSHRASGCRPCALFGADLSTYRSLLEDGVLDSERRAFESGAGEQRAALKKALVGSAAVPGRRRFPARLLSAAAMIAIVGFVSVLMLRPDAGGPRVSLPGGESFRFEAPQAPNVVRDGGEFARGRAAFAAADHLTAAAAFDAVEADDPRRPEALFYAGVSYLLLDEPGTAIDRLTRAREAAIADGLEGDRSSYYLALARIDNGDVDRASELLRSIQAGPHAEEAASLLSALED